jgi:ribonuclease HII
MPAICFTNMPRNCSDIDMFCFERQVGLALADGCIAGVDEAGRGPLAGPVVAAAIILPPENEFLIAVADSKTLTAEKREALAAALRNTPGVRFALAKRSAARIDQINILQATHEAMRECILALEPPPAFALVDGLKVRDFPVPAKFLVKGDSLSASIAAASILAKTWRDELMLELDRQYPHYGFRRNKGYGSKEHLQALQEHGPCPEHRRSFAPVARCLVNKPEQLDLPLGR